MYEIIFDKKALQEFNKLIKPIKERIWEKLQKCKQNPFHFLEPLVQIKGFKLRIGDYRAIIDVQETIKVLNILKVGHRKNVYDR